MFVCELYDFKTKIIIAYSWKSFQPEIINRLDVNMSMTDQHRHLPHSHFYVNYEYFYKMSIVFRSIHRTNVKSKNTLYKYILCI